VDGAVQRRALCALLRGEPGEITSEVIAMARADGVLFLLAYAQPSVVTGVHSTVDVERRAAAVFDHWRERQLRSALDALAARGVGALLIKGAGLAYTHYAESFLRPRGDLDILIAPADVDRADRALVASGWTRSLEADVTVASAQRHYVCASGELSEQLDLHWRMANARAFADARPFSELFERSTTIPALGDHARTLSAPDALWLACVHRVAHHFDDPRLLWLYDIHLLAAALTGTEEDAFVAQVMETRVRRVAARGLRLATECFRTRNGARLAAAVDPGGADEEPSAAFLAPLRTVDVLVSDVHHAGGWTDRWQLMREHLFPPLAYMSARYPRCPSALLPLAYAFRIARGAPAWFRR
jgi:hypothetical protein